MSRAAVVLLFFTVAASAQQLTPEQWAKADQQVRRLPPSGFPQLPAPVRTELERRGCTIPQVPMIDGPHNVIHGEFAKPGQTDWAVLCSIGQVSSILVFWNGSPANPAEIAKAKDVDRLQGWGGEKIVYSWMIQPIGSQQIMVYYNGFGGEKPPPMDHLGIDDVFYGKASVVLYFYHGKWMHLTGAD
jgi:hypothetical protein